MIPSWNGEDLLKVHLPSVLKAAEVAGSCEVVVCDDGSTDGTADLLASRFPAVRLARRDGNGGFSHAANDGVAASKGRVVVLLNNDMEVRPDAVARLADAAATDQALFAAVPSTVRVATRMEEALTRIRYSLGVVSTSLDGKPGEDPAYACGGAMAFRRDVFESLGGFDTLFSPFYWEDVDLSYRARKRGRRIKLIREARVDHDHGRTIGARFDRRRIARIYERNRLLFTWKNLTDAPLWREHLASLPAKVFWDLATHPAFVAGLWDARKVRRRILGLRAIEKREAKVPDRALLK